MQFLVQVWDVFFRYLVRTALRGSLRSPVPGSLHGMLLA
jgi:putative effector of murein hydrolase LrgA (UPF0299 family)